LAILNGVESLYSHYKTNLRYRAQWIPVVLASPLAAAGIAAILSRRGGALRVTRSRRCRCWPLHRAVSGAFVTRAASFAGPVE
jgi:hypothetical protein